MLVGDAGVCRRDDDLFDDRFLEGLRAGLTGLHDVVPFRSSDAAQMDCLLCQVSVWEAGAATIMLLRGSEGKVGSSVGIGGGKGRV